MGPWLPKRSSALWLTGCLLVAGGAATVESAPPPLRPGTRVALESAVPRPTEALRLAPPAMKQAASHRRFLGGSSVVRLGSSLAIVLGVFACFLLVQRWLNAPRRESVPTDVIRVYGRVPLNPRQRLLLVRVGQRLLVLLESPQGIGRLAEIVDPEEVARLLEQLPDKGAAGSAGLAGELLSQMGVGDAYRRA